jgi:hypothetical protein
MKPTSIKIIGLGGIGQSVARYGALYLAAQGTDLRLVLIDGDSFEPSNATRMFFGECGNKATVTRNELLPRVQDTSLSVIAIEQFITPQNIDNLIREDDLVILCVDNHATRKLVNDHVAKLSNVCLISSGNDGVGKDGNGRERRGTYGNVQIFIRKDGKDFTPALTHFHPEIENPKDKLPSDLSCTDLIASVPQILFTNLAVASATLNAMWLYLNDKLHYSELCLDVRDGLMRPVTKVKV